MSEARHAPYFKNPGVNLKNDIVYDIIKDFQITFYLPEKTFSLSY